jgi:heptosyltransferase-2
MPVLDSLGAIIFFPLKIFKKSIPSNPKNILVVRLDHIGDFVCTTPLFKNIKQKFPNSKITVLLNSSSKELAYRDTHIDKVITFSPSYLNRREKSSTFKGLMRVAKDIRNIGFDLGIEPRGDILSIFIMWLGGVKYRIGYGITGGGFLLHKECVYDKSIHVIDRNLALLKGLSIPVTDRSPAVYFNEKDINAVDSAIRESKIGVDRSIVLHPFAGAPSREWAKDNFQDLIDRLRRDNVSTFLIGTNSDKGSYANIIDMKGKFNLPQLAYFIKRVGFFIGLNSGPANIAAALGVPSIVISSGTNIIEHWIPMNDNIKFVYKDIECRPCETAFCPKDRYECMDQITAEEVFDKFKELYGR